MSVPMQTRSSLAPAAVRLLACGLGAAALIACGAPTEAGPANPGESLPADAEARVFTEEDSGRTVEMAAGTSFEVRLGEIPGTGYGWRVEGDVPGELDLVSDELLPADPAMPGAEQAHVFVFTAREPGVADLQLAYRRPWETDAEPLRRFALEIEITD